MKSLIVAIIFCFSLNSCVVLFSKSHYPVTFESTPSNRPFTVTNRKGEMVYKGTTPAKIPLKSSSAFFEREIYSVTFTAANGETVTLPITFHIDGWYIAEVFGGPYTILFWLVLDPLTGSMYTIDNAHINADLQYLESSNNGRQFRIMELQDYKGDPKDLRLIESPSND